MPFQATASAQQSARRPSETRRPAAVFRAEQERDAEHGGRRRERADRVEGHPSDDHRGGGDRQQAQSIEIAGPQIGDQRRRGESCAEEDGEDHGGGRDPVDEVAGVLLDLGDGAVETVEQQDDRGGQQRRRDEHDGGLAAGGAEAASEHQSAVGQELAHVTLEPVGGRRQAA